MTDAVNKPSVLFVCVKNAGKSQMAAGLMSKIAGDAVQVYSAGTKPGTAVNTLSAEVLSEVGVDITDQTPKPMDPRIVQDVDVVVTLGREAHIEPVPGTQFENPGVGHVGDFLEHQVGEPLVVAEQFAGTFQRPHDATLARVVAVVSVGVAVEVLEPIRL